MRKLFTLMFGMAAGAGVMYFLDPERGRTRRAMVRDQASGTLHDAEDTLSGKAEHLRNKAQGYVAEARSAVDEVKSTVDEVRNAAAEKLAKKTEQTEAEAPVP